MSRPSANFWNDGAAPALHPGMNDRETAIMDYSEELSKVATANTQSASYTLVLADAGKVVEITAATAANVTIPPNSSVAFPVGTVIEVYQHGAGTVSFVAGAGVTIRSRGGVLNVAGQYGSAALRKRATDEWVLIGDLA